MDRDLKFRIQKISDEGSQVPFTARIWFGIMNLRDEVFNFAGIDPESGRKVFDKDYKSVLDSLVAMRTASKNIKTLITDHRRKGELGQLVVMQRNAVEITESIDIPLMHNLSTFINSGARALKAMQPLLVKFKIEIDFLFQKETNFQKGLQQLEAVDRAVAEYISAVRTFWSERFMERRNSLEHHGWYLPNVEYRISPDSVVIIEPEVDALPVTC